MAFPNGADVLLVMAWLRAGCGSGSTAWGDMPDASRADVGEGQPRSGSDEEEEDRETATGLDAMSRFDVSSSDVSTGSDATATDVPFDDARRWTDAVADIGSADHGGGATSGLPPAPPAPPPDWDRLAMQPCELNARPHAGALA